MSLFRLSWIHTIKAVLILFLLPCVRVASNEELPCFFSPMYGKFNSDFCPYHLQNDPEACSSFTRDPVKGFCLEYLHEGSASVYIDSNVLKKLSPYKIATNCQQCSFMFCNTCKTPVKTGFVLDYDEDYDEDEQYDEDNEDENSRYSSISVRTCLCLNGWTDESGNYYWDDWDLPNESDIEEWLVRESVYPRWIPCSNQSVPKGYFDIHKQQFLSFSKHHLAYIQENRECSCYWPYRSKIASQISEIIYEEGYSSLKNPFIKPLVAQEHPSPNFPYLKNRSIHGVLSGIFTHAFFYSQYRAILLELLASQTSGNSSFPLEDRAKIDEALAKIQPCFVNLYSECLSRHPHPKIHYERGMVLFHQGLSIEALDDIKACIEGGSEDLRSSELYFQEGSIYAEVGLYDLAVGSLSKAIDKDPSNKDAYFERACAYFELGKFDESLEDYLSSGIKPQPIDPQLLHFALFSTKFAEGICKGGIHSGIEFIPSLLSSIGGMGQGLWAFTQHPAQMSWEFIEAACACAKFIKDHSTQEVVMELVPELKELVQKWDQIEHFDKGERIGYIVGKYGINLFAGSLVAKQINAFKTLKKANQLATLEAMAASKTNKAAIQLEAVKRAQAIKDLRQSGKLKIEWDKQGKHIKGHRNYQPQKNRSILEHPNPQKLIDDFSGKGMKANSSSPGISGYQEIVNFKEFIGYAVDRSTGQQVATTWGKIHYANGGVHLVPTKPRG